jgi:hypothetical protein
VFQKDLEPSRIIGLMRTLIEAQGFLNRLTADRVAILSFDWHLKIWVDFTNDHERLRRILDHGILFERRPQPTEEAGSLSWSVGWIRQWASERTASREVCS